MTAALARAERARLAQVLGVAADELTFLESVPADDLRALRLQVVDHLYDLRGDRLRRVAAAARLAPAPLAATLAEVAVGPVMAGLMASAVEPRKLLDIAGRLRPAFVAEVCPHLDPRRIPEVVARLPTPQIVAIAHELARRDDHVTMAQFVGHLDDTALLTIVEVLSDEDIVRTAPLVEDAERVDLVCASLDDDRLTRLVHVALTPDLVVDVLDLLAAVGPDQLRRLGRLAIAAGTEVMGTLVGHAAARDLWDGLLPLVGALDDEDRARLAADPALHEASVLDAIIRSAIATGHWLAVLPLAPLLPPHAEDHVAVVVGDHDEATLATLAREAAAAGLAVDALGPVGATLAR